MCNPGSGDNILLPTRGRRASKGTRDVRDEERFPKGGSFQEKRGVSGESLFPRAGGNTATSSRDVPSLSLRLAETDPDESEIAGPSVRDLSSSCRFATEKTYLPVEKKKKARRNVSANTRAVTIPSGLTKVVGGALASCCQRFLYACCMRVCVCGAYVRAKGEHLSQLIIRGYLVLYVRRANRG